MLVERGRQIDSGANSDYPRRDIYSRGLGTRSECGELVGNRSSGGDGQSNGNRSRRGYPVFLRATSSERSGEGVARLIEGNEREVFIRSYRPGGDWCVFQLDKCILHTGRVLDVCLGVLGSFQSFFYLSLKGDKEEDEEGGEE